MARAKGVSGTYAWAVSRNRCDIPSQPSLARPLRYVKAPFTYLGQTLTTPEAQSSGSHGSGMIRQGPPTNNPPSIPSAFPPA